MYESYKSAYNLLEYIGSTGTQYIDTGYVMSSNTEKIYADYEKTDVSDSVSIFGAEKNISGSDRSFTLIPYGTSTSTIYIGDDSSSLSLPSEANVRYRTTLEANGGNLKVSVLKVSDNTTTTNTTTYTVSNGNLTAVTNSIILFGNHTSSGYSQLSTVKIYSFKLWDNGVLKRNLVPVSRKSDNVLGMYDTVNNVFYTNSGTGTFTAGSVIE